MRWHCVILGAWEGFEVGISEPVLREGKDRAHQEEWWIVKHNLPQLLPAFLCLTRHCGFTAKQAQQSPFWCMHQTSPQILQKTKQILEYDTSLREFHVRISCAQCTGQWDDQNLLILSPEPSSQSSIPVYSDASPCLVSQLAPQMEKVRQECQEAYLTEKESWTAFRYYPNLPQDWDHNWQWSFFPAGWCCTLSSAVWLDTQVRLGLKNCWQWGVTLFGCWGTGWGRAAGQWNQQCCHHVTALGQAQIRHL